MKNFGFKKNFWQKPVAVFMFYSNYLFFFRSYLLFLGFEGSKLNLKVCHGTETWLTLMIEKYRKVFLYVVVGHCLAQKDKVGTRRFKLIVPKVKKHTHAIKLVKNVKRLLTLVK